MHRLRIPLLIMLAAASPATVSWAQTARLLPADDPAVRWIARLQERGYLASLHPTARPYVRDEVAAAVAAERVDPDDPVAADWLDRLGRRIGPVPEDAWLSGELRPGVRATSNGRLDPLRVLDGGTPVFTWGTLQLDASAAGFTVAAGLRHDLFWDRDPDGMDSVLRLYMRSDHSFVGYRGGPLLVHLGRIATDWSAPESPGLLLGDNPRPMDALHLRLGGRRLALRSTFAELDAMTADGRFTGTAGADSVAGVPVRRWLAAHRIDWRPTESLALTVTESVLFSGPGTGFSLKYLNPIQPAVLAVDNRPKNDENNGLVGVLLWWRAHRWIVTAEMLVDDFDFVNGVEPASAAASASLVRPAVRPWLDVGVSTTAVTARTYGAPQAAGRYTYLGRSIGAPFADFAEARVFARLHLFPGVTVEPTLTALWQGEQDIRRPLPSDEDADTILTGIVERTVRVAARVGCDVGTVGRLDLDLGVNHVSNAGHVEGRDRTLFVVSGGVSLRLALSGAHRFEP